MSGGAQWTRGGGWLMPDALARELVRDESPFTDAERGAIVSAFLALAMGRAAEIPAAFALARETFKAYAETAREAREKYEARKERERLRMQEKRRGPDGHGGADVAATRADVAATRGDVAATRGDVAYRKERKGKERNGNEVIFPSEPPQNPPSPSHAAGRATRAEVEALERLADGLEGMAEEWT